jgi:hypothetical protein
MRAAARSSIRTAGPVHSLGADSPRGGGEPTDHSHPRWAVTPQIHEHRRAWAVCPSFVRDADAMAGELTPPRGC